MHSPTLSMFKKAAAALAITLGCNAAIFAGDSVLYEQIPSGDPFANVSSQDFPDAMDFSIVAADDFLVPDGPGWSIDGLTASFTTGNGSGLDPIDMRWIIFEDDNGQPGTELLNTLGGSFSTMTGLASIAFDTSVDLAPGNYWLASQIVGEIGTFGQEFQLGSDDGFGTSNFLWNNPGGAAGLPDGWVDANSTIDPTTGLPFSDVANLAFSINGAEIPEPATLALLGVGAIAAIRRRK